MLHGEPVGMGTQPIGQHHQSGEDVLEAGVLWQGLAAGLEGGREGPFCPSHQLGRSGHGVMTSMRAPVAAPGSGFAGKALVESHRPAVMGPRGEEKLSQGAVAFREPLGQCLDLQGLGKGFVQFGIVEQHREFGHVTCGIKRTLGENLVLKTQVDLARVVE
jgi:hypothetical protein